MAFTIPLVPKESSFPEDPWLPKFFYDEVAKEEEQNRSRCRKCSVEKGLQLY